MSARGSFRARLVVTLIGLVATTVIVLGVGAYLFVSSSLRGQLAADAVESANFNLAVLATEWLDDDPTSDEYTASPLEEALLLRGGVDVFIAFAGADTYASKSAFFTTPDVVSQELQDIVAAGNIGREWVDVDERPYLVVAGRRPPSGPDFFFFYPAEDIEDGLLRLRQALLAGGIVLVLLGAATGNLIARRVLAPVRQASTAALEMADGDLSVRLAASSDDEFGAWSNAFNRMAGSLEDTIERLEEARARERRFVADVSHELRTPLTGLVNEAALLKEHLDAMPADGRRIGELLIKDVGRIRRLVDDLLEISSLDAGAQATHVERVDVRGFISNLLAARLPEAVLIGAGEPLEVDIDRRRLERIVGNLVDNARQHAGGAHVEVEVLAENGQLVVAVSDRGPGVEPTDLDHLFDRFSKADRSRSGAGSGLGLAIARQHARQMGGDLTASLRSSGGMLFQLRLPL